VSALSSPDLTREWICSLIIIITAAFRAVCGRNGSNRGGSLVLRQLGPCTRDATYRVGTEVCQGTYSLLAPTSHNLLHHTPTWTTFAPSPLRKPPAPSSVQMRRRASSVPDKTDVGAKHPMTGIDQCTHTQHLE
jgi:hypothetical protein